MIIARVVCCSLFGIGTKTVRVLNLDEVSLFSERIIISFQNDHTKRVKNVKIQKNWLPKSSSRKNNRFHMIQMKKNCESVIQKTFSFTCKETFTRKDYF